MDNDHTLHTYLGNKDDLWGSFAWIPALVGSHCFILFYSFETEPKEEAVPKLELLPMSPGSEKLAGEERRQRADQDGGDLAQAEVG